MAEHDQVWRSGEDVQVLENALRDSQLPANTRKALLKRASTTLLAAGGIGALISACGSSKKSTTAKSTTSKTTAAHSSASQIQTILNTAATAEALAVTYLSAVIKKSAVLPWPSSSTCSRPPMQPSTTTTRRSRASAPSR